MKLTKSNLKQIIKEEIEALIEDNPCKPGYMEKPKGSGKCYPATPTDMGGPFQVEESEESEELKEAWKGDPKIKQTGQYADKTVAQLKKSLGVAHRKAAKEKETGDKKVNADTEKKQDQLNFAIRSKTGWKKGKGASK